MTAPEGTIYSGGLKFDAAKPRYDLIPPSVTLELLLRGNFDPLGTRAWREVATVYAAGATKYEDRNWERGMKWTRLLAAACRHFEAYLSGEPIDRPSGSPHLACIAFSICGLIAYSQYQGYADYDDRTTELVLTDDLVRRYQCLFRTSPDVDELRLGYIMLIHWQGRRCAIDVKRSDYANLFRILEEVLKRLEAFMNERAKEEPERDFIPDVQRLSATDLKADLDSRELPVPIIGLPPIESPSTTVVSGNGNRSGPGVGEGASLPDLPGAVAERKSHCHCK